MKTILTTLLIIISLSAFSQNVTKAFAGYHDTVWKDDTVNHTLIVDYVTTTKYTVSGIIVSSAIFKKIDIIQKIVIAEGLYDANGAKIEGTENRYFFYLQRIPFTQFTQEEINKLKNN